MGAYVVSPKCSALSIYPAGMQDKILLFTPVTFQARHFMQARQYSDLMLVRIT
jgi:hypothetical protein